MGVVQIILAFIVLFGRSLRLVESVNFSEKIIIGSNETDRLALLEFKKQTYDPYGSLSSWNDSIYFCNWVGIYCSRHHQQRATSLDLRGMRLGGNISPSIGNLTFLHYLDIQNNSFYGEIPQEIGNLFRLQYVAFGNNTLQGQIPSSLANCIRLREIHFAYNNFSGEIPVEVFKSLRNLEALYISFNNLMGEIPASFGNLSSIQTINLRVNQLQGSIPESFGQLKNLRSLALGGNNLCGMLPISLFNLSALEVISVPINKLHGSIPQDIGLSTPNLKTLAIARNLFSGNIPSSISNISTLEIIDFADNNFFGPVPNNLGNLKNLQMLFFSGNQLGTGKEVGLDFLNSLLMNCTDLTDLELDQNRFTGPLPNFKANHSTQLSYLLLGSNQISGTIPTGVGNLISLTNFGIEANLLEGNIPFSIGNLPKLQKLYLGGNRLSGQIPSSICNPTLLYELHLEENKLDGLIPSSIGKCQHLQILTLDHNRLQGPIPKQLFLIPAFSISLNLSYNSLTGSLPVEIGKLKSLSALDISNNSTAGEIPSSIGECESLEYLFMGSNFFEGTIPQPITLLKGLQYLDLSINNLSGQIPKDLDNLVALKSLNLSFNNLEGEVPTTRIFGNASAISVKGNEKLCGGIMQLHLPTCTNHGSTKQEKYNVLRIVLAGISAVLGFILISSFLTLYLKRRSKNKPPSTAFIGEQFLKLSYKDLFQATRGFSSANFMGSGSFGSVFKGIIDRDETIVAVKVLNLQNLRAHKSFMAECKALRNIRHRNLVKILTSCSSLDSKGNDFKALIYEFMPNGCLDDWLHLATDTHIPLGTLSLLQRLNISIDVASGLDYLHNNIIGPVVHCDLKPSNILLDGDLIAHIGDFGLARLLLEPGNNSSETQSSTIGIKGSIGYVAPEYGMGGNATIQGDIFSYGILLLEMFTGKRPTNQIFTGDLNLRNFAMAALPEHVMQILDPALLPIEEHSEETEEILDPEFLLIEEHGEETEEIVTNTIEGPSHRIDQLQNSITSLIEIAVQCSMESPRERMNMNDVLRELQLIKERFSYTKNL